MKTGVFRMNYVGIDIGSTASKVVVRGEKAQQFVMPTDVYKRQVYTFITASLQLPGIKRLRWVTQRSCPNYAAGPEWNHMLCLGCGIKAGVSSRVMYSVQ